jgi:hypothetical protein
MGTLDIVPPALAAIHQTWVVQVCVSALKSFRQRIIYVIGGIQVVWFEFVAWRGSMDQRQLPVQKHLFST